MEIKVTSCADCPFAGCDYDGGLKHWCNHFGNKGNVFEVETHVYFSTIQPSCPLKQQSITVKLESNEKESKINLPSRGIKGE